MCIYIDAAVSERDSDRKESRVTGEDGEQSVTSHDERVGEEDLDDDSIFTCDNCQQDFECLADLTEHRTNHCPAGLCMCCVSPLSLKAKCIFFPLCILLSQFNVPFVG